MKNEPQPPASPENRPRPRRVPPAPLPSALPPLAPSPAVFTPRPCGDVIPILIPLSPGRPGVWVPARASKPPAVATKPVADPNAETRILGQVPSERPKSELNITLRLEPATPVAPASMTDTRTVRRTGLPSTRPAADAPTKLIPKLTVDERRRRLLEAMLEVEAKLEMLDDPVPF